jgi:hypothetical protein
MSPELRALIATELDRPASAEAQAMAARLARRPGVAAVLFYGARLRESGGKGGGPLDFYVLTDSNAAYHGAGVSALFNRILPPNVYHEIIAGPPRIEAKVAVASVAAFRARMRRDAIDTSFWARFTQPVTLAWARAAADRDAAIDAVAAAVETAAWWAAHLGPADAEPEAVWQTLFRHTYGQELRVESGGRADGIVAAAPERYRLLHRLLIEGAPAGHPDIDRPAAARTWRRRRRIGKALNLARLLKAAFTYRGGIAYALSKVERHSGRPVELRPWERRLPWLAAPVVAWRLWREGRLR